MTDSRSQLNFQVRLGWGKAALELLAPADIVVIVDAIADISDADADGGYCAADTLATQAANLPHRPTVFKSSLRNRAATAKAIADEQVARGGRTAINLLLVGDAGLFAVDDYLAAGALGDALTKLGIDHTAPDLAVATEGFRPLMRALKHLLSASAAGLALAEAGRGDEVRASAELDGDSDAVRARAV